MPGPRTAARLLAQSAAIALSIVAAVVVPARAASIDVEKAARVKAAYLLNFARYTQWPDTAFAAPESPIVMTEIGNCEVGDELAGVVARSEPIGGRSIALRRAAWSAADGDALELLELLRQSHVVYLCPASALQVEAVLSRIEVGHVLTVGDTPDFAANGGMIGFILDGSRIVFQANPKAIQSSGVTVSAKVLKLAQIVEGEIP